MNVLSLFDGMSCGQVALQRAGIHVDNYFASEIDKYAIKVTMKNHPNTIQLGSVVNWREWNLPHIDLLIAGSPCQGFSKSGKGLNFDDPRSKLFFEFVNIRNALKPDKWLLENVDMKKEWKDIISDYMGIQPVKINSALVSAQNRVRLYWANWNIQKPKDRHIYLKDIIENGEVDRNKSYTIDANYSKGGSLENYLKKGRRQIVNLPASTRRSCVRVGTASDIKGHDHNRRIDSAVGKSPALTAQSGGNHQPKIEVKAGRIVGRRLNNGKRDDYNLDIPLEQLIEINQDPRKTNTLSTVDKDNILVYQKPHRNFTGGHKLANKSGTLREAFRHEDNYSIMDKGSYRKLTVVECERLQTLDDGYTAGVSDAQRYRMLGNGWTVEVIADIFSQMRLSGEIWHMARQSRLFVMAE